MLSRVAYLESSKVDHAVNGRVLGKDLVDGLLVGNVELVEVGTAAADQLNAVEGNLGRVVEAVDNDDIVSVLEQSEGGEGTNVAGSAVKFGPLAKRPN
jgi:hypothetical protein